MELTISNFKKIIPSLLLKAAGKCEVREYDEMEKNYFVAYVDEKNESYDVSTRINTEGNFIESTCDCKNADNFCLHKTALIIHITKLKTESKKAVKTKKQKQAITLLEEIGTEELKIWVRKVIEKNTDLELHFIQYFTKEQKQYNPDEILKSTAQVFKKLIPNKRKADPTLINKVVGLWKEMHQPIIDQYLSKPDQIDQFKNLTAVISGCLKAHNELFINTKKISSYAISVLKSCSGPISILQDENVFEKAVDLYIINLFGMNGEVYLFHMLFIDELMLKLDQDSRRKKIITQLLNVLIEYRKLFKRESTELTKFVFHNTCLYGNIINHCKQFEPLRWENEYNHSLIKILMNVKEFELAKKYCIEQINYNTNAKYDLQYFFFLKEIYKSLGDDQSLAKVIMSILPLDYNIEDYFFVINHIKDEALKEKWRNKILQEGRLAARANNQTAIRFFFQLALSENKIKKMISYIETFTPYDLILQHFDIMASIDKSEFLRVLLYRSRWPSYEEQNVSDEELKEIFEQIYQKLIKNFPSNLLMTAVKKISKESFYSKPNQLVEYLLEK
jgi:hypothetical protein